MKRRSLLRIDWWLLAPVIVLVIISLTTLFSIDPSLFRSQVFSLAISLGIFYFLSQLDIPSFRSLALPIYVVSLILLGIVLLLGFESHGAIRWIGAFGAQVQISEICKPLLILSLASFLSNRPNMSPKVFVQVILYLIPIALLIFLQPDLGNTVIYISVAVITLLIFGYPLWWFLASLIPLLLVSPIAWEFLLHDYQRKRILTFFHPAHDPLGSSYNVTQAIIAVGSGQFFGKGLGEGTQSGLQFLPEQHTDFIFATISEGLGFVGATIVILAFVFLCFRLYQIFRSSETMVGKLVVAGAFSLLLIHFFVNIGMNIGLVPVVGVTLPFVSYGGSSLLANFMLLGLVSSISVSARHTSVLEIR